MNLTQNSIKISSHITQNLSLSKNLIFSLKILSLNAYDLYRLVEDEMLSNPALICSNRKFLNENMSSQNFNEKNDLDTADEIIEDIAAHIETTLLPVSKKSFLLDVLHHFLDEKLFLKRKAFLQKYSSPKYSEMLLWFKHAKPSGIGACHLQERFKHQLEFYGLKQSCAYQIVDECWKYFLSKQYLKIQNLLKKTELDVQQAVQQIKKFCKSNLLHDESHTNTFFLRHPDVILQKDGSLELNERYFPKIQISEKFIKLCHSTKNPETALYLKEKIHHAKNIQTAIEKRNRTLLEIARIVVEFYNQTCPANKNSQKRLTLKDLALKTHLSQSTISRTLKHKTILTPHGLKIIGDLLHFNPKDFESH